MASSGSNTDARRFQAILLIAALACLGAGWADSWEAIRRTAAGIDNIQLDFVQEKHLAILARPLVSRGRLTFRKPDSLRWQYDSPVKSLLLMRGERVRQYVESDGRLTEAAGAGVAAMPVVMGEIALWLGGRFAESPDFNAELIPGRRVVLTPRRPALARIIQRIELEFDETPGMIRRVTITESETSVTALDFENARLNQPLPETLFEKP
jgi:outer membrane lipoprotein-sorting protein